MYTFTHLQFSVMGIGATHLNINIASMDSTLFPPNSKFIVFPIPTPFPTGDQINIITLNSVCPIANADNERNGSDPEVSEIFSGSGLVTAVAITIGLLLVLIGNGAILFWLRSVSYVLLV